MSFKYGDSVTTPGPSGTPLIKDRVRLCVSGFSSDVNQTGRVTMSDNRKRDKLSRWRIIFEKHGSIGLMCRFLPLNRKIPYVSLDDLGKS